MSLISVDSNDLVIGKSTPWSLYDQERKLLLRQGEIVRDAEHQNALLASGACHELTWETSGGEAGGGDDFLAAEEVAAGQPGTEKTDNRFTFDDMKLKVGDRLQLEPPPQLAKERFVVKVIGFLRGASLLVTAPITASGLRLQLLENEKVVLRSFTGQNAFGFACTIERIIKIPYEYMHLSFPDVIQGIMIRKAPRIKTRIIATVQYGKSGAAEQLSALISDVSANGVSLESKKSLGSKGAELNLAFRVQLHNVDAYLTVQGVIRAVLNEDASDAAKSGMFRYGIELQNLQPNDSVILQSMIYQQMIENPQNLV